MTSTQPLLFGLALLGAFLFTVMVIWSSWRTSVRMGASLVFALFIPLTFLGWSDLLSRPKPARQEWLMREAAEANVIAGTYREGVAIYLWLELDGVDEPRAYELPWSQSMAEQLEKAQREAEGNGTGVRMRLPFEQSLDPRDPPQIYALPQQAMPPKPPAGPGPEVFKGPEIPA